MAQKFLAPDPVQSTFFIPGGYTPGNGVQVFVYLAGTTTKTTVYKDDQGVTAWSNPIVLDSGGNLPSGGSVWITQGETIKIVWAPSTDTDPPASPYRTIDDIVGINDVTFTSAEWVAGTTPSFVSATSFTLSGDLTSTYMPGRRIKTTNTGGTIYSTVMYSAHSGGTTTIVVQNDSGSLDSGLSAVSYSLLSANNPATPQSTPNAQPRVCGRLTVSSQTAVPTNDVVGTTAVWFTPYNGNVIDIYDGSQEWNRYTFSQISTAIPDATQMNDVFIYNSTGVLRLETVAWTNETTRATAVSSVAGVPTKAGDATRLYLGSFFSFSTSAGTSQAVKDTREERYLWNYWNRTERDMQFQTTTVSFTQNTANTTVPFNNLSTNALKFCLGMPDVVVQAHLHQTFRNNNSSLADVFVNISLDAPVLGGDGCAGYRQTVQTSGTFFYTAQPMYQGRPGVGKHSLIWTVNNSQTSVIYFGGTTVASGSEGLMTGTVRG